MRHLSLLLAVLLLGALPLTAAALDYGPNRALLAAESGAPPLPGVQTRDASVGAMPKAGGDEDAGPDVAAAARPASTPGTVRPGGGPTANNKPPGKTSAPATTPSPASWQSLLPGSIQ